jgi:hypothetical protein
MQRDKFPIGVAEKLGFYVYRLIDPRNGETFYVGKGKDDRIFQHAKGVLSADISDEDAADLKLQRIKDISAAGLEVGHVIHRHNIESEELAFQIEAAVIDAYPGLSNEVGGHGSGDYGVRHVEELITEYAAEEFEPKEKLILISIAKSYEEEGRDIYITRYAVCGKLIRLGLKTTSLSSHIDGDLFWGLFGRRIGSQSAKRISLGWMTKPLNCSASGGASSETLRRVQPRVCTFASAFQTRIAQRGHAGR